MNGPVKKIKTNCEAYKAAELADIRERRQKAEAEIERLNVEMTQMFCPFVNGNCRRTCVHFDLGVVLEMNMTYCNKHFIFHTPKCRMWRN